MPRVIERTPAFMDAIEKDHATGWDDQYMRLFMRFGTGAQRYAG